MSIEPVCKTRYRSRSAPPAVVPHWKVAADYDSAVARGRTWIREWLESHRSEARSWLTSVSIHVVVLLVIGLTIWFPGRLLVSPFDVVVTTLEAGSEEGFIDGIGLVGAGPEAPAGDPLEKWNMADAAAMALPAEAEKIVFESPRVSAVVSDSAIEADDDDMLPVDGKDAGKSTRGGRAGGKGTARESGANVAGLLDGRGDSMRAKLVKKAGGTKETERAVQMGLDWLARHQKSDGSWTFQHGPDDPGMLECPTGATGLALMCFLGAGNTHQKGYYKVQVERGLRFLLDHFEENNLGGWFQGTGRATMYVQGICTIALCEAYSMSKDATLRNPAQRAVDFIVNAQDREGGGWRYQIPSAGDTSVVGWQVMALTSARIAELKVHPRVLPKVAGFLKRVESETGGMYGYTSPRTIRTSTTAAGLLCRMYLGREQTHRGLIRGMKHLDEWGANTHDMYYGYYGTMAMHHWGGPAWERWNNDMRKLLVDSQAQDGDAAGSWITDRSHGAEQGGRLYTTCLSILTLEVYYRYLPIYRKQTPLSDDADPPADTEPADATAARPAEPAEKGEKAE
ncbi:MAG: terpene cyclase/mutase family protein [Planctomycetia bacterium]|nr:terpene cyclase/mutase family protein [Planctomycetia bacterium]